MNQSNECQIVSLFWLLSAMSFIQKHRSLAAPRLRRWSVSVLHSQARSGSEPTDIGFYGSVEKTGTRQQPPTSSRAPNKRGSRSRDAIDTSFADTGGNTFSAKFDAVVDEILPGCNSAVITNFVRIAGKKSRDNTVSHMIRRP